MKQICMQTLGGTMGQDIKLKAEDGHELGAYRADPAASARGGIVVLQEIFGVNAHIREVCNRFAEEGYAAVAPALYDRSSMRDCRLGYEPADMEVGRKLREEFSWDDTVKDVKAAVDVLGQAGLKIGTVGYCWGGTISYLAATRLPVNAAVVYYGGQIIPYLEEKENCPLLMHFGKQDQGIPLSDVDQIRSAHPEATVYLYDAGHGFSCDHRGSFHQPSADLARERTLAFFATHVG
jgi:carboxymethylenebutenolidase